MPKNELSQTKNTPHMDFFPAITPYSTGFLNTGDGHELYWEQSGNPDGVPIVFLHGGPGAGASEMHRRFFDPGHYRIIIFDQRGCGRSSPFGSLENNSSKHLVGDVEALRNHLHIDQWIIFGGSWGSTLALLYAIDHGDKCLGLILRGIFLCEQHEINWFMSDMHTVFPEAWEQFTELFDYERDPKILLDKFYAALTGNDEKLKMDAAIRWSLYEGACALLIPNYQTVTTDEQKRHALTLASTEAHFFKHDVIASEDSILTKIDKFRHIPGIIVQGRYDMICPLETAYKLHKAWPEADYVAVPDAGHSAFDPALRSRLIQATENFKSL